MAGVPAPRPLLGAVLLLFVSAAWGSAFPLMQDLIYRLPVEDLLAERYTLAALTLFLIRPGSLRGLTRRTWINGLFLGLLFGVGQSAQAVALHHLPAAVSGFAVGCTVVITPVMAVAMFRAKVPYRVWVGVVLALVGMTVFTLLRGAEQNDISLPALAVTLASAALYSGHTLMLARLSRRGEQFDAYALTVIQLGTIGVLTGLIAVRDGITLPASVPDWLVLGHLSVISCALGFLARSYGQAHVPAVPSAVLMSSQPFWVAAIAVIWFGEQVGVSMIVGGLLMAGAMLLAVPSSTSGALDEPQAKRRDMLMVARRASRVLGELKVKRDDPLRLSGSKGLGKPPGQCSGTKSCPWQGRAVKGTGEPSLERLLDRAGRIARAGRAGSDSCCASMPAIGTCLCELMDEPGAKRRSGVTFPCRFRPQ